MTGLMTCMVPLVMSMGPPLLIPAESSTSLLLDGKALGRVYKYINDPSLMPGLQWKNPGTSHSQKPQQTLDAQPDTKQHTFNTIRINFLLTSETC